MCYLRQILFPLILILICPINISAQISGYTFIHWEDIYLADNTTTIHDTVVVIITNRTYDPFNKEKKYFGNEIDPAGKLRYLVASCTNNKWTVSVKETFEEAMEAFKVLNNFLFFVHGDGKNFPNVLDRCIRINRLYNVNVIAFDWPSKMPDLSRMRNFYNSKRNANNSVMDLKESLEQFQNFKTGSAIISDSTHFSLFFHSLGNQLLKKFKEESLDIGLKANSFDNVILNAAAVKQKRHRKWVDQLNFQKRIYITSNKKDHTLLGAHLITFRRQLGERLKKPLAKNANYVNFRNLVYKNHNYFLDLSLISTYPSLRFFYKTLFHGRSLDFNDTSKFRKRKDRLGYDIL